jgi:2-aminoadipate transaminase
VDAVLPVIQFVPRPGVIDLARGYPHPAALPVPAWADAYGRAMRRYGPDALMYGHGPGPGPLIEWLCAHLGHTDGPAPPGPDRLFVTAGASHGLELLCSLLLRPGDAVLVDSPTYHFALRILADHSDRLVPAPTDGQGIEPAGTAALVRRLRREGRRVPLLYLVPTFGNPTGASLAVARRTALVAALAGLTTVVEDDTYRELHYEGPAPPSLYALAGGDGVVRIGSFAKTVAPGLRLGWITGPADLVAALGARGFVDSGGGVNHATALAMAEFGATGYREHVRAVRGR